jgi:hypothetical protein
MIETEADRLEKMVLELREEVRSLALQNARLRTGQAIESDYIDDLELARAEIEYLKGELARR